MKRSFLLLVLGTIALVSLHAQNVPFKVHKEVYKQIDGHQLEMTIYTPVIQKETQVPAIVFYFGGGWVGGNPDHFKLQAEYLVTRGIVVVCPDYRTKRKHNTSPFECVKDARSAMRYLKEHALRLQIDSERIVAAGGSAGGHLAACTAIIDHINEETDPVNIVSEPCALVLFNPVVDTGFRGYGSEKVKGREFEISPVHHISSGVPETLIFHGKADKTVPYENVSRFQQVMEQAGNSCKLVGFKKLEHGFFNFNKKPKYFKKTLAKTERFLEKQNLLSGKSWLKKYYRELLQ